MKILIVRLGALGDIVHAIPAVAALRRTRPDAEIDWVVEARHHEIVDLVSGLRRRVLIDTRGKWHRLAGVVRALRRERYDAALDLQGLVKSAVLARLSGARRVIGFDRPALREPAAALMYSERHVQDDRQHVVYKNLALAGALAPIDARIEFPLEIPARAAPVEPYALLNPGAAWPNKRWPADRFGALARWMRERHGLSSLVLWGPGERDLAEAVAAASSGAASVAPATRIADVLALARGARLVVSGDTGPLHLAAAVAAPVIGLYGPTTAARNGPWRPDDVTVSRYEGCACHYERRCRREARCIDEITVEDVERAVDARLASAPRPGVPSGRA